MTHVEVKSQVKLTQLALSLPASNQEPQVFISFLLNSICYEFVVCKLSELNLILKWG